MHRKFQFEFVYFMQPFHLNMNNTDSRYDVVLSSVFYLLLLPLVTFPEIDKLLKKKSKHPFSFLFCYRLSEVFRNDIHKPSNEITVAL